jgi:hypothetical protein
MNFLALKDFWSEELKSQYVKGLSYSCPDDRVHAKLKALLPQWIKEGKIASGAPLGTGGSIAGRGKVK